jgi:[methyl-Co(III) methanol-specific corrinoid protein]:coenzyme M methyltransferase
VTLKAIALLRQMAPDVAVVGATVGPLSLAGQVLEASLLLRATHREAQAVHELLRRCTALVADFARQQVAAGADVVMIADPTATGEIIGARAYSEFAAPYLRQVIAAVHEAGAPVIVHICGCPDTVLSGLSELAAECLSFDETAHLRQARAALTRQRLMGNISADLLQRGPAMAIASNARQVLQEGVDILAPACGVIAATPAAHLRVLREVAESGG